MTKQTRIIRDQVKALLVDVLALDVRPAAIGDDDPLFDGAVGVDSVAAVEILAQIEDHFGIHVNDEDAGTDLFHTVGTLAGVVERYLAREVGLN